MERILIGDLNLRCFEIQFLTRPMSVSSSLSYIQWSVVQGGCAVRRAFGMWSVFRWSLMSSAREHPRADGRGARLRVL